MKKILFVVALFCGVAAFGQGVGLKPKFAISGMSVEDWLPIPGYTKINFRYEWIAGAFDSGLHVPQYNGVPSGVRSGVWQADGAIAADTSNHRLYFYSGGSWRYSTASTSGGTPTWQQTLTAGSTLTGNNTILLNSTNLRFENSATGQYMLLEPSQGRLEYYADANNGQKAIAFDFTPDDGFIQADDSTRHYLLGVGVGGTVDGTGVLTQASTDGGTLSFMNVKADSIVWKPHLGTLNIDTLRTWSAVADTTYKKPMTWDTRNGRWEYASNWFSGGGVGSTPISSLTDALASHAVSGASRAYSFSLVDFSDLIFQAGSAGPGNEIRFNNGGEMGISANNGNLNLSSASTGIYLKSDVFGSNAANGDLAISGTSHTTKTTSYVTLQKDGGLVGIGTSTPDSLLHNAGSLHNAGNGRFDQYIDLADISAPATPASGFGRIYTRTDSLRYKNDAGTEFTLGLGGGGTPGGSDNEVQYNNGGAFGGMTGVEYYGAANMVLRSQAQAAADVAIIGKAHASQSANIFEVQNSSGTSIGYITAAGRFGATDFYGVIGTDIQLGNVLGTGYNVLMAGSTFGVRFRDNAGNLPFQWDFGSGTAPFQKMVAARMLEVQGTDVASIAGAIALTYGNTFEITGTNAITLISNVNWQNGSVIYLLFTSTATLTDGTANSGTDIGMELAGGANFTGSADDVVTLILGEIGGTQRWREVSRSVN